LNYKDENGKTKYAEILSNVSGKGKAITANQLEIQAKKEKFLHAQETKKCRIKINGRPEQLPRLIFMIGRKCASRKDFIVVK
jgi:hypothetical protein